jgi:hypothetical protein
MYARHGEFFYRVEVSYGPRRPEPLAEGKGVRREAGSEGSRRQNADLTNRNRIQGLFSLGKLALDSEAQ